MSHARHLKASESHPLLARGGHLFQDDPTMWKKKKSDDDPEAADEEEAQTMQAKLGKALRACPGPFKTSEADRKALFLAGGDVGGGGGFGGGLGGLGGLGGGLGGLGGGGAGTAVDLHRLLPDRAKADDAQSLRGVGEARIRREAVLPGPAGFVACATYCFRSMLEREQQLGGTHVCYYHSYNSAALLYEVQAELARAAYGNMSDEVPPPLPRLLKRPYAATPTLAALMAAFGAMAGQDHNPTFRQLAICASLSLFGGNTEAPPLQCFSAGYAGGEPPNLGTLLRKLLAAASRPPTFDTERVAACLEEIGNRYQGGRFVGHMLQLFVRKDVANSVSYVAQPMGVPVPALADIVAHTSGGSVNGQARVFMHPDIFLDAAKARVFHYCAIPELCSAETKGGGLTRGSFVQELRNALKPVVADLAKLRKNIDGAAV